MGNVNSKKSKSKRKAKSKRSSRYNRESKRKNNNNTCVDDTPTVTFEPGRKDVLVTKRSYYYNKLGIEGNSRNSLCRSNSLNRSLPCLNFGLNEKLRHSELSESLPCKPSRTSSTERLLKLNFLLKKKSEESSKSNLQEFETANSTPHKSLADTNDEENLDNNQEIFESFCIPSVDEYQLDYRKKVVPSLAKDADAMRHKYLHKLAQNRVWLIPSEKPISHQSIIIFDWDDTLLCTSYLNPDGYATNYPVPLNLIPVLEKLESVVVEILEKALDQGEVYIITNAAYGWVEFSSKKYFPKVFKLLDKIKVVSARSKYEIFYPGKSNQWKVYAFADTMKEMERGAVTNIVAIGDSNIEMEASKKLANKFPRALLKTVKLKESPTPDELIKQLVLISSRIENICQAVKNLTVRLEKKSEDEAESST